TPVNGVGFTTPILIQSVSATNVTLQWYRFSDGSLVTSQSLPLNPGSGIRVDPWSVSALSADAQYSVVATASGGTMTAIVTEFAPGGDNAVAYEGFAAPSPLASLGWSAAAWPPRPASFPPPAAARQPRPAPRP